MAAILDGTDLYLTGAVGFDLWDDYFTFSDVLIALLEVGRNADLTIHLNSPGGFTDEGTAIANAIRGRSGRTSVVVEGVAMSAATFIACAADEVVMGDGSIWMVHEPMITLLSANSQALESGTRAQKLLTDAYALAYTRKTGRSDAQVRSWMKAETYFGADEAVEAGFADRKSADVVDFVAVAPAWDYGRSYAQAPERLVAKAKQNDWWRLSAPRLAATAAPTAESSASTNQKEGQMPNNDPNGSAQTPAATPPAAAPQGAAPGQAGQVQAPAESQAPAPGSQEHVAPVTPAAPEGQQEGSSIEAAVAAALAADRRRAADINAACGMFGRPDDATDLIDQGKTLSEALAALRQAKGSASAGTRTAPTPAPAGGEINARNGGPSQEPQLRVDIVADARKRAGKG